MVDSYDQYNVRRIWEDLMVSNEREALQNSAGAVSNLISRRKRHSLHCSICHPIQAILASVLLQWKLNIVHPSLVVSSSHQILLVLSHGVANIYKYNTIHIKIQNSMKVSVPNCKEFLFSWRNSVNSHIHLCFCRVLFQWILAFKPRMRFVIPSDKIKCRNTLV